MPIYHNKRILVAVLFLTGCATVPPQPRSFEQLGQYQTIPLNSSSYRISFKADAHLSYGNAEEITLLKAAQFTVQQGYDVFKVLDDPSNRSNQQQPRQAVIYPNPPYFPQYPYHRYRPYLHEPFMDMPYVVNVEPTEISYTIQMFKKQLAPADAFEAVPILRTLGAKYGVGADGTALVPENKNSTLK